MSLHYHYLYLYMHGFFFMHLLNAFGHAPIYKHQHYGLWVIPLGQVLGPDLGKVAIKGSRRALSHLTICHWDCPKPSRTYQEGASKSFECVRVETGIGPLFIEAKGQEIVSRGYQSAACDARSIVFRDEKGMNASWVIVSCLSFSGNLKQVSKCLRVRIITLVTRS